MRAYPCPEKNEGEDQQNDSPGPCIHSDHLAALVLPSVWLLQENVFVPVRCRTLSQAAAEKIPESIPLVQCPAILEHRKVTPSRQKKEYAADARGAVNLQTYSTQAAVNHQSSHRYRHMHKKAFRLRWDCLVARQGTIRQTRSQGSKQEPM